MLNDSSIIAFVATQKPEASRDFYVRVLGLRLVEDNPFAIVFDVAGTMLRIQKVQQHTPAPFTALGWRVDDIDATVAGLAQRGVSMERFPGLEQDAAGVWVSPNDARIAWFRDPDGNLLSLTQFGPDGHQL